MRRQNLEHMIIMGKFKGKRKDGETEKIPDRIGNCYRQQYKQ